MENQDEVLEKPEISRQYMQCYMNDWRTHKRSKNKTSLAKILNFIDVYFPMLSNSNYQGYNMRITLKKVLKYIENDLKIDAKD